MAIKLVTALTFFAVVNAASVAVAPATVAVAPAAVAVAPAAVAVAPAAVAVEEYDPHPQYKYGYDVQDNLSGDSKGHVEERDGDVVRGEYSLIDADGFRRIVSYTADPINGFNAVVRREPLAAPVVASAPVLAAPAPLAATAPVAPAFAYRQL